MSINKQIRIQKDFILKLMDLMSTYKLIHIDKSTIELRESFRGIYKRKKYTRIW